MKTSKGVVGKRVADRGCAGGAMAGVGGASGAAPAFLLSAIADPLLESGAVTALGVDDPLDAHQHRCRQELQ